MRARKNVNDAAVEHEENKSFMTLPKWLEQDILSSTSGKRLSIKLRKLMLKTGLWLQRDYDFYESINARVLSPAQLKYKLALERSITMGYQNKK